MFLTRARTDCGAGASSVRVASVVSFTSRTRDGAEADAARRSVQEVGAVFFNTLLVAPGEGRIARQVRAAPDPRALFMKSARALMAGSFVAAFHPPPTRVILA
jgi:hypothetical protein